MSWPDLPDKYHLAVQSEGTLRHWTWCSYVVWTTPEWQTALACLISTSLKPQSCFTWCHLDWEEAAIFRLFTKPVALDFQVWGPVQIKLIFLWCKRTLISLTWGGMGGNCSPTDCWTKEGSVRRGKRVLGAVSWSTALILLYNRHLTFFS